MCGCVGWFDRVLFANCYANVIGRAQENKPGIFLSHKQLMEEKVNENNTKVLFLRNRKKGHLVTLLLQQFIFTSSELETEQLELAPGESHTGRKETSLSSIST